MDELAQLKAALALEREERVAEDDEIVQAGSGEALEHLDACRHKLFSDACMDDAADALVCLSLFAADPDAKLKANIPVDLQQHGATKDT